jgi:hypothetical protein
MPAVGHVVKTLVVKIPTPPGTTPVEYQCAVTGVEERPTRQTVTSQVACPDGSLTDVGTPTYELVIGLNVDWNAGSLYRLLRDNDNVDGTVTVEWDPIGAPGVTVDYEVTLVDPGANAQVGAFAVATATLPVRGYPTITDPAP